MAEKEYIEREAFRREIDEHRPGRSYEDAWALTILDSIPAADVRPVVRGKWKHSIQGIIPSGQCSNCGAWDKVTRFCPNCGADMREES